MFSFMLSFGRMVSIGADRFIDSYKYILYSTIKIYMLKHSTLESP